FFYLIFKFLFLTGFGGLSFRLGAFSLTASEDRMIGQNPFSTGARNEIWIKSARKINNFF
ncbi:MAG: hypothetical protein K2K25_07870, partial [Muribaculaceae bacterium]|nr:hypothetical protein [Muribaculaceae bacterium]